MIVIYSLSPGCDGKDEGNEILIKLGKQNCATLVFVGVFQVVETDFDIFLLRSYNKNAGTEVCHDANYYLG